VDTDPWDIAATQQPNMPTNMAHLMPQADRMAQALLADRFKRAIHRETRERPVYELVVAPGGSKLKTSTEKFSVKTGRGHFEFRHVSLRWVRWSVIFIVSRHIASKSPTVRYSI
jgi:uncharacterized protein (TIGR03435 family)